MRITFSRITNFVKISASAVAYFFLKNPYKFLYFPILLTCPRQFLFLNPLNYKRTIFIKQCTVYKESNERRGDKNKPYSYKSFPLLNEIGLLDSEKMWYIIIIIFFLNKKLKFVKKIDNVVVWPLQLSIVNISMTDLGCLNWSLIYSTDKSGY